MKKSEPKGPIMNHIYQLIHYVRIRKRRKKEMGTERLFEDQIAENYLNLKTHTHTHTFRNLKQFQL